MPSSAPESTRNPVAAADRQAIAAEINGHLAAAVALFTHIKQAHWNVQGDNFVTVHELLDTIAGDAQGWADLLAERVRQLGVLAEGTLEQAAARHPLPAYPTGRLAIEQHVGAVADRLGMFSAAMYGLVESATARRDPITADIATEIARAADKHLWFLESTLPPGVAANVTNDASRTSRRGDDVDETSMESFPASDAPASRGHKPPRGEPARSTAGAGGAAPAVRRDTGR